MTWNLPKIREACLKLMGHKIIDIGDPQKDPAFLKAVSPMGEVRIVRYLDCALSNAPDPTRSLDDAVGLMEKYGITLSAPSPAFKKWHADRYDGSGRANVWSAPLAVCLCALRCAGRDLKEFEE